MVQEHEAANPQMSALQRIGSAEVLAALHEVKEGRIYDLGTEYYQGMPSGSVETVAGMRVSPYRTPRCLRDGEAGPGFDFSMELISGSPHLGSHIDGLAHIQSHGKMFGGIDAKDVYDDFGWQANGIESTPPIIGRGLLLDIARSLGRDPLPDQFEITPQHVKDCLEANELTIQQGDTVLIRTGKFAASYHGDGQDFFTAHPGVGRDAAVWLYEQGMAVLGTDTTGTEPKPFADRERTVHSAMLVDRGVHLLEILDLEELASDAAYEFLLICLPLKFRGGTGSWVRPVAVV